jgi:hypothetical protein
MTRAWTFVLPAMLLLPGCRRDSEGEQQPGDTSAASAAYDSLGRRPEDAAVTVRSYLASLTQRDFERASLLWDDGATAGAGDSAAFRRAHGDTTITRFEVGAPGTVEGAAGSRYITVPVVVHGATKDRPPLLLHGVVTLRRSVVDGASEPARRWRISRIEWSTSGKPDQRARPTP